jgi:hypothetical protein
VTVLRKYDVFMYVLALNTENELVSLMVLRTLQRALDNVLRGQVSQKTLVDNLDLVVLCIDEICESGMILEDDPDLVASRVAMNESQDAGEDVLGQSLEQAWETARDQWFK